ncbi:MAG: conjugal transfer protein TraG N-terminal domain-containing protein, partial [Thermodesulfobacteriota bacterium]|nr:conjugal transfer protein TraG N-terminal domain-containing protein [Thermodesulfobacteriota bacterium]
MKKPVTIIIIATCYCLLLTAPAMALDMEYYTYGGFNPITQAFTKIALIFSDSGYQGLLFVIMVLGLIAGVAAWLARAATGARVIPLVWAVPVLFGAVLYLGLFVPKGNITVYDPVVNRFQTIGNVPNAVVFTAGFLNKIERGMVDIIDTAAVPDAQYQTTAGGIGFKALESVKGSSPKDNYVRTSMIRYIKDCVTFELVRPGTTLSLDDLRNNTTDFLVDLAQAVNPAVYTVYYDSTNPEGTNVTCTDAWNNLQPIYANPTNYDEAIKKVCSKAYFDPSNTVELNTCKSLLTSTLNFTTGTAVTPEKIIQQRQIAEILYNFYFQDDYETAVLMEGNRKVTSTGLGIGLTMNEWIPIIRAVMTAIAIGVIPFLVLFLFTPVVGKAISVMFGFFVFLTTWGITDAVIHGAAMDYATYAFEDMRQSNLGVYAMAAFPTISVKLLAMFGVIRSSGIMLASFFSMMLIRFGGHALAMLAGNLSRIVQSAGAQAGQLLTPEGSAAAMN